VAVTAATVAAVEPRLSASAETIAKAGEAVDSSGEIVARVGGLVTEGERMLEEFRPVLEKALPPARRFVEQLSDHEVDAAIAMVDEFPELSARLKNDIVPILATLDGVAPNVAELVKLTDDVRQAILGIPGFGRLRRRGAEKIEEEEEEEAAKAAKVAKRAPAKKTAPKLAEAPAEPVEDPDEPRLF
ncbi:MAG: hypothetical protein ACT4QF_20125, partial [Sporichthyaceae bacterium]